eukprot:TRINITY_DN36193_c0_g1_i1.p1 TRINITY_DN36193_c0_g1~~TRINITY_DN36193_c0_g1_i1.p1  ORF type:complete len:314 (-),score=74.92 TRINITY_DN36193_c0_g1_i1:454-1395(-)
MLRSLVGSEMCIRDRHAGLHGAIDGTGAAQGNTGDFQQLAQELGCKMELMDSVWGSQCILEESLETFETASCIFQMRGDSFFLVDANGSRVVNEKLTYDSRVREHWKGKDSRYLIYICDQRNVDQFGSDFFKTIPADPSSKFLIKGDSVEDLSTNIRSRLASLGDRIEPYTLADSFQHTLEDTLNRFNTMAESGVDDEFGRGDTPHERQWQFRKSELPNPCLHPLDQAGPLYAMLVAPQAIDTKGGAAIDLNCQCIKTDGSAVPGLYGAGNAVASPSGDAYWSGGATIGLAMVTGWVAGNRVAKSGVKELDLI